ncbi:hypothetical protein [Sporosarcina ureilytica]|uniref:Uncharacterized protein n=1 Tax=Sporosarcina ureilytica TaxID=298596 RepID=A0A1D8JCX1_9BACL|nr:hypothetical protein [Sporosarcina ureilytica]AOV06551.1 hypothetical protein BI350_02275 [Sporosarcina ureilytica]
MSNNDCGCGNSSTNETSPVVQNQRVVIQQVETPCTRTFHETVTEAAELIITPNIISGPTSTRCVGEPRIVTTFPTVQPDCRFTVEQDVCAQFEVTFGAHAEVGDTGVICGEPGTGPCPPPPSNTCCLAVAETNQGNTDVTTTATLNGNPLEAAVASPFSIKICSPNCELEGSHFNLEVHSTTSPDVHFEINHQEITEMSCNGLTLNLTAVSDLHIGSGTLNNVTFNITINPTSFSVVASLGGNTIFTSTSTTDSPDVIDIAPCNPS